jgi:DNA-binding response OmpR family regulator
MGRIVLIEDSADYAFLVQRAFQTSCPGEEILHFSHGADALGFFASVPSGEEEHAAWLVLTDLQMPELNGFQVLSALKSNPRFSALPIVILTTSDSQSDREKSLALGAEDFITKPARIEELRGTLKALCKEFRGNEAEPVV